MTVEQRANNLNVDMHNSIRKSLRHDFDYDVPVNAAIVAENIAFDREVRVLKAFRKILGDENYTTSYNRLKQNHDGVIANLRAR